MATNGNDEYFPEPSEDSWEADSAKDYLKSISNMDERREKLCQGYVEQRWATDNDFITLMNCESLFPSDEDKRYFTNEDN
uniref:Uncharacterized protein n=1 Tax=Trichogramma kaykai TaxID=54128 RepID=A0ABD2VXZ0_9HYME